MVVVLLLLLVAGVADKTLSALLELHLGANDVGDVGANALAAMLHHNSTLRLLEIRSISVSLLCLLPFLLGLTQLATSLSLLFSLLSLMIFLSWSCLCLLFSVSSFFLSRSYSAALLFVSVSPKQGKQCLGRWAPRASRGCAKQWRCDAALRR